MSFLSDLFDLFIIDQSLHKGYFIVVFYQSRSLLYFVELVNHKKYHVLYDTVNNKFAYLWLLEIQKLKYLEHYVLNYVCSVDLEV